MITFADLEKMDIKKQADLVKDTPRPFAVLGISSYKEIVLETKTRKGQTEHDEDQDYTVFSFKVYGYALPVETCETLSARLVVEVRGLAKSDGVNEWSKVALLIKSTPNKAVVKGNELPVLQVAACYVPQDNEDGVDAVAYLNGLAV